MSAVCNYVTPEDRTRVRSSIPVGLQSTRAGLTVSDSMETVDVFDSWDTGMGPGV